jgi:hypothetical protein
MFTLMTNDLDHCYIIYFISGEINDDPTLLYTKSPKVKVIVGEHV